MASKKLTREKITQEEYDFLIQGVGEGKNAYQIYREQQDLGSIRSASFWGRWVKRVLAGQTLETYGKKNFIPEMTGGSTVTKKPQDHIPIVTKGKLTPDLRAFSEAGILLVQEALGAIVRIAECETELRLVTSQLQELQASNKTLQDKVTTLEKERVGDRRALETAQGYQDNLKEYVSDTIYDSMKSLMPRVTELMKAGDIIPEREIS